ncbi:MAG: hypothetical protein HZA04_08285 [Nitrospinae bacterium]|nr:hypothetical protein [Nitrospinota bacterium]
MRGIGALAVALAICAASTACATLSPTQPPPVVAPVPGWALKTPTFTDKLCAVGTCEPTGVLEDAKSCAAESARAELAKSISVQVQSIMIEETKGSESRVDSARISGIKGWVADAVLTGSVIEEYWYDKEGRASHSPGVTFALACIPKSKVATAPAQ